jgi:putative oxidoreductase
MNTLTAPARIALSPRVAAVRADFAAATHAVLRAGTGLLFLEHGLQKALGLLGGFMGTPGATAPLGTRFGAAGVIELVGGFMLLFGLFTRPVAVLLLGEMMVAFLTVHLPQGGSPLQNGGELALLYAVVFAFLAANGAGPVSVDAALASRRLGAREDA